jgi:hypothetical protein
LLQARYWFSKVFYHSLQIGNPGAVALVLNSGVTLIRRPFDVEVMRKNVRGTEPYFYRTPGPSGRRSSSQRRVASCGSTPTAVTRTAFVAVASSKGEILHEWWRTQSGIPLTCFALSLCELDLLTSDPANRTRDRLSLQDGLTWLANRRDSISHCMTNSVAPCVA